MGTGISALSGHAALRARAALDEGGVGSIRGHCRYCLICRRFRLERVGRHRGAGYVPGVFISRGMTVGIPAGGLTISLGPDGQPASSVTLHVHFDVCPTWCELAMSHSAAAAERRTARIEAWAGTDEDEKAKSLEREFESSMQAAMAAAIALDAFYSVIQSHVQLPPSTIETWRTKRTARYSQITEVLRRGFHLKSNGVKMLRASLKEIYRFRDLAIHPSGKIGAPLLHPELNVGVEWRFAYFRATNAEALVNAATAIIWDLTNNGEPTESEIIRYTDTLRSQMTRLFPSGHPLLIAGTSQQ